MNDYECDDGDDDKNMQIKVEEQHSKSADEIKLSNRKTQIAIVNADDHAVR